MRARFDSHIVYACRRGDAESDDDDEDDDDAESPSTISLDVIMKSSTEGSGR